MVRLDSDMEGNISLCRDYAVWILEMVAEWARAMECGLLIGLNMLNELEGRVDGRHCLVLSIDHRVSGRVF